MKILIAGLSKDVGGIENLFYNLFKDGNLGMNIDFLAFGDSCAYEKEFKELGYGVYHIPTRRDSFFQFKNNVKKFFLTHNDYDYIWYNTASTSMYQIQYCGKKYTKAKVITHSHGTSFDSNSGRFNYLVNKILSIINYNKVINSTDLFFCCSYKAGVALFGKKHEKNLILIKNGINVEKYKFNNHDRSIVRDSLGLSDDITVVSVIGRLSPQKNPVKAIEIFEKYSQLNDRAVLLLVGTGELYETVVKCIEEKHLEDKVKMLGFRTDVEKIMSCSDIMLMPSLFEGLPLTAIEAQCNGLECILADTITTETKITEHCSFVSLDECLSKWANEMQIKRKNYCREKCYSTIIDAGYSIEATRQQIVKLLENYDDE